MKKKTVIIYAKKVKKDVRNIDDKNAEKIRVAIQNNVKGSPLKKAKSLRGRLEGLYRYRIGNYRVVFEYDEGDPLKKVTILQIKHRKDIYKKYK